MNSAHRHEASGHKPGQHTVRGGGGSVLGGGAEVPLPGAFVATGVVDVLHDHFQEAADVERL